MSEDMSQAGASAEADTDDVDMAEVMAGIFEEGAATERVLEQADWYEEVESASEDESPWEFAQEDWDEVEGEEELDELDVIEEEDVEAEDEAGDEPQEVDESSASERAASTEPTEISFVEPVGEGEYTVEPGDCLSSIAVQNGHFWETIWNDPQNQSVKTARSLPNLLLPGDRLHVEEIRLRHEDCATEQLHKFRRRGVPDKLRLRFLIDEEPRAGEAYLVEFDTGERFDGELDGEGRLEVTTPGSARRATVTLGDDPPSMHVFQLGGLDPVDSVRGVQQRLANMGHTPGELDGKLGDATRAAIAAFQSESDLEPSGIVDQATRDRLRDVHDLRFE